VERATGTDINEYYKSKLRKAIYGFDNPISLNEFQADSAILQNCRFSLTPKDWFKIAQLFLLNGIRDTLSIKNGNGFLFLSKPRNLILLWIGNETPDLDIYGFVKKLSEPG
jgi:hypothetical protein